ncbi:MAG TPA: DnaB-like helicase N-terminal domain-containing protein, partial [Candidatus Binatia bacterium]|nr:DnaB-like helicase N-terminal domain-containing protein [Candidatus Binatia bacterium]
MASVDENLRKVPPQNLEAEASVLGGILRENDAINRVLEIITPTDFYRESHRKIFRGMMELSDKSEPVDLITLSETLKGKLELDAVGGSA